MMGSNNDYINGYLERKSGGRYEGELHIEGIDLSPITGVLFKQEGKNYLWLRRKDMLEYDIEQQRYITRKREPRWEAYLEKQVGDDAVAYKGEFPFMCLRFSITGLWDAVVGRERSRLNFYVERLPMERQDIINGINKKSV